MNTINIKEYGEVISSEEVANEVLGAIKSSLKNAQGPIIIDFSEVVSFSTFCARQIFGTIFQELKKEDFLRKLSLVNANDSIKSVITSAINSTEAS